MAPIIYDLLGKRVEMYKTRGKQRTITVVLRKTCERAARRDWQPQRRHLVVNQTHWVTLHAMMLNAVLSVM